MTPTAPQRAAATSGDPYFPRHGNDGYRVRHYDLALQYQTRSGRLAGRAVLTAVATEPLSAFSLDLGRFRVEQVLVDHRPAGFRHTAGKLSVRPAAPVAAGAEFTVRVRYVGVPKGIESPWGALGWEQLGDGALVANQPIGAPSWFPCNDHPGDKAAYRITVTAPSRLTVVANGLLTARRAGSTTTTWVYEQAEPTPTYLATVQIGAYAPVELAAGPIPLRAAVPARLVTRFRHDFGRQDRILAVFEKLFGPYPFDEYTVVVVDEKLDVPVEAQGLSIFGANHVDGRRGHERLVAHELAHQWFGNSVTAANWRHIWLHEGFASYSEWLWSEASGSVPADRHAARWWTQLSALPQDIRPADPGVRRMFDDRVYRRGALTLHALRTTIGDAAFFALVRAWTARYRHDNAGTDDFVALAARHAPVPLDDFFRDWLHTPTLPPLPS
ncbi:aminopeptidase [Pilimelia anulata]|uniref:Aminopeptidase N n=1 Tax=Pilimelia anulata TaxID=53371 RepID=A0A8J3B8I0_9ACTN|nr:M1 family metallopeptidase [Pilimelia anulata]GGJ87027.1 aminopeptidase [Pilimelia anulata]